MSTIITVKTAGKGTKSFWRAGLQFTEQARELEVVDDDLDCLKTGPTVQITDAQYEQIKAEPMLRISTTFIKGKLPDKPKALEEMKRPELQIEAEKRGLSYGGNDSNAKLIELIREHDAKAATDAGQGEEQK